jgi:hypothetical protein
MRRNIIRSLAITTVLGGTLFTAAGVAAADQGRPTGGDKSPTCSPSDLEFEQGCFAGWGPFFKK